MPAVRAKMYVAELRRNAYSPEALQVQLQVVSRGEENKDWAAATPTGTLTLGIQNGAAAEILVDRLGQEFYVTLEPVDPA